MCKNASKDRRFREWAMRGSNPRPHGCDARIIAFASRPKCSVFCGFHQHLRLKSIRRIRRFRYQFLYHGEGFHYQFRYHPPEAGGAPFDAPPADA
jgi:hypothetical protein